VLATDQAEEVPSKDDVVVICLSGRGDKDVQEVSRLLQMRERA
jgi:tryptophan synthase beta subunit